MKTIFQICFTIFFIVNLIPFGIHSQTVYDSLYDKAMYETLVQLDSAGTIRQLQHCKNRFERIAQRYPDEWLPLYYAAYCGVNSIFYDAQSKQNRALLDEAGDRIERLFHFPQADLSEINTLKGYYLTAMIVLDPEVNGQKYFSEIIGFYEKAMDENPENPRPVFLLADFERRLPAFVRSGKRDPDKETAKARLLFEKEQPNIEKPYWGKYFLRSEDGE